MGSCSIKKISLFVFVLFAILNTNSLDSGGVIRKANQELSITRLYQRQLECLALNIYHEARSESYEGQVAVATVTLNRMRSKQFPKTICGVVWQSNARGCQFSWTCDNKSDRVRNWKAYKKAERIAEEVLFFNRKSSRIDSTVLFYHNDKVTPRWADDDNAIAKIGRHTFYKG